VDYAAKGSRIDLEGAETVEGRDTYKLKVTEKNGQAVHVWVDAETFLETKAEGQPRRLDGTDHPVELYYRDYRTVDGLLIPFCFGDASSPRGQNGPRSPGYSRSDGKNNHRKDRGESQARRKAVLETGSPGNRIERRITTIGASPILRSRICRMGGNESGFAECIFEPTIFL
jgi:hypothetical protein